MPEEKVWTNVDDFLRDLENVIVDDHIHDLDELNQVMNTLEEDIFEN